MLWATGLGGEALSVEMHPILGIVLGMTGRQRVQVVHLLFQALDQELRRVLVLGVGLASAD